MAKRIAALLASLVVAVAAGATLLPGSEELGQLEEASAQDATGRPNIVVVMADDLDERSMQDLGGIRDLMGANGATFENAYFTYALCCPSRATFLRGQYPHNHQIIGNGPPEGGQTKFRQLGRDKSTVATWLNDAGYQTKLVGKYMNSYDSLYVPPGWDEWYAMMGDHWGLSDPTTGKMNDDGVETTLGGHSTDVFADKATDFIRRGSAKPEPFFVMVGTKAPHSPPEVADRYKDRFLTTPLPKPPNFDEADVSDKPQYMHSFSRITPERASSMQSVYRQRLRSMLSVEDLLRQVVATLQETGELENTYVIFTSDNGYHIGNHRFGTNKKTPYEEDIGMPLMVRGPGVPAGAVRQQLVLNNDVAPTIADLAGVSPEAFVDGRSFAPLLTSAPPSTWRTAFIEEGWLEGGTTVPTPTHKSVHTQRYMFTEYDTGERELYDLAADPYQLESLPRAGNEQLYSELQARLDGLRDCAGADCRAAEWDGDITAPPPQLPPDTRSPRVASTSPGSNATGVAPSANPTATFSEDMDGGTINATTLKLMEGGSATRLPAAISYSTSTDTATLDPTDPLRAGVTYKAVVTTGAKDLAGNPLDQNTTTTGLQQKAWLFTVSN